MNLSWRGSRSIFIASELGVVYLGTYFLSRWKAHASVLAIDWFPHGGMQSVLVLDDCRVLRAEASVPSRACIFCYAITLIIALKDSAFAKKVQTNGDSSKIFRAGAPSTDPHSKSFAFVSPNFWGGIIRWSLISPSRVFEKGSHQFLPIHQYRWFLYPFPDFACLLHEIASIEMLFHEEAKPYRRLGGLSSGGLVGRMFSNILSFESFQTRATKKRVLWP